MINTELSFLDMVCCPACRGGLTGTEIARTQGLLCKSCHTVFPAVDGIPMLLPQRLRDPVIEGPPLEALATAAEEHKRPRLAEACRRTARRLVVEAGDAPEWQTARHWSAVYERRTRDPNINDRAWASSYLFRRELSHLHREAPLRVIDIGCGDGLGWRRAFAPILPDTLHYVGVDLSIAGMVRARRHRAGARADYLVATADELPFRDEVADILICHRSLHQTMLKEATIPHLLRLLRPGGRLICMEPVRLLTGSGRHGRLAIGDQASIDPLGLHQVLDALGAAIILDVLIVYDTILYGGAMRIARPVLLRYRPLFLAAFHFDRMVARSAGRPSTLRPRQVGFLIRKR